MSTREPFITERLFCPGPTPVPLAARLAAVDTSVYHRTDAFYQTLLECRALLSPLMGSSHEPLILTASGTGAMEAAVVNLTDVDDEVIVVNGGKFGERWEKLATAYGCQVATVQVAWGDSPSVAQITAALKAARKPKAFFIQANETSTGVHYPLADLLPVVRSLHPDCLIVVDAISALGAHELRMHEWAIDCVVAGSQKGFGIPPGLAFVTLSERAWHGLSRRPRYYFDLARERKNQETGATAWTPATTLVASLHVALKQMHEIGIERVLTEHERRGNAVRRAVLAIGLSLFPKGHYSNAVTAIDLGDKVAAKKLLTLLSQRFGAVFAGGQDQLSGKILRFGHLGFLDRFDLLSGMAALEFALAELGYSFTVGAGVQAAMQALAARD